MSRRDVVVGTVAAAVSALLTRLLTYPRAPKEVPTEAEEGETLTEANELLRRLPDEIEGARLEKHEVPGAQLLVVHVANKHHVSLEYSGYFKSEKSVEQVQAENAVIIPALMKHLGTFVVFDENLTPERMAGYRHALESQRKVEQHRRMSPLNRAAILSEITSREKEYGETAVQTREAREALQELDTIVGRAEKIAQEEQAKFERINGCLGRLAIAHLIEVRPALTEDAQNINVNAGNYKNPDVRKKMFDDREDVAIDTVVNGNTGSIARILYFGGKHDFRRRLARRNVERPDQKISLVQVTCPSLLEEEK